jgi:hypothetical protein
MPARSLERRRRLFRRGLHVLDRRFLRRPFQYLLQASLAALTLGVLVAVKDSVSDAATTTVIACSAVVIFMAPHSGVSGPRRILAGHAIGLMVGLLAHVVGHDVFTTVVALDLTGAAAVGASMLGEGRDGRRAPAGRGHSAYARPGRRNRGARRGHHRGRRGAHGRATVLPALDDRPGLIASSMQQATSNEGVSAAVVCHQRFTNISWWSFCWLLFSLVLVACGLPRDGALRGRRDELRVLGEDARGVMRLRLLPLSEAAL